MIESVLVMKILMMCMFEIDPRFDKKQCAKHMVECTQKSTFSNCAEFWEPFSANSEND
jgi:hypothetical protein